MSNSNMTRRSALAALGTAAFAGAAAVPVAADSGLHRELAAVRSATARYNSPRRAYEDGYVAFDHDGNPVAFEDVVDEAESVCGMGIHFINMGLVGTVDRTKPQVLAYGVPGDSGLLLGAVEYIVPKAGEYATSPPDLFAHDDGSEDWHEDEPFPGVWSMHVWVHTKNPDGVFNATNPRGHFFPDGCETH